MALHCLMATTLLLWAVLSIGASFPQARPPRAPDVFYVPTPLPSSTPCWSWRKSDRTTWSTISGAATAGSRLPRAQKFGAHGVGIDIDPKRIEEATENAKAASVTDQCDVPIRGSLRSVHRRRHGRHLYLLPSLNEKLMPKLQKDLKPGTRIVSHAFTMGDSGRRSERREVGGRTIYTCGASSEFEA